MNLVFQHVITCTYVYILYAVYVPPTRLPSVIFIFQGMLHKQDVLNIDGTKNSAVFAANDITKKPHPAVSSCTTPSWEYKTTHKKHRQGINFWRKCQDFESLRTLWRGVKKWARGSPESGREIVERTKSQEERDLKAVAAPLGVHQQIKKYKKIITIKSLSRVIGHHKFKCICLQKKNIHDTMIHGRLSWRTLKFELQMLLQREKSYPRDILCKNVFKLTFELGHAHWQ